MGRFDTRSVVSQDPNVKHMVEEGQRPARIKRVAFGLQSGPDMMRSAEIHVTSKSALPARRAPRPRRSLGRAPGSCTRCRPGCRPRTGASTPASASPTRNQSVRCVSAVGAARVAPAAPPHRAPASVQTCNKNLADCTGHFGYVRVRWRMNSLPRPPCRVRESAQRHGRRGGRGFTDRVAPPPPQLELPVFHIGYFKATVSLLQMVCKVRLSDGAPGSGPRATRVLGGADRHDPTLSPRGRPARASC